MTTVKLIVLFGLFAIASGFALPERSAEKSFAAQVLQRDTWMRDDALRVRNIRSPQKLKANLEHSDRHGSSATLQYTHPLGSNWEAYAQASRNFRHNDNSGHVGLTYSF